MTRVDLSGKIPCPHCDSELDQITDWRNRCISCDREYGVQIQTRKIPDDDPLPDPDTLLDHARWVNGFDITTSEGSESISVSRGRVRLTRIPDDTPDACKAYVSPDTANWWNLHLAQGLCYVALAENSDQHVYVDWEFNPRDLPDPHIPLYMVRVGDGGVVRWVDVRGEDRFFPAYEQDDRVRFTQDLVMETDNAAMVLAYEGSTGVVTRPPEKILRGIGLTVQVTEHPEGKEHTHVGHEILVMPDYLNHLEKEDNARNETQS